ncbi:T9SS type A sorting domain-containing protein [Hymenobacter busanensis]|uniref:T9SS type A sorting domain-containing protein n=1 Tax=Hymenobacter busanensis TaxID=2607656 RepID=A0A7L4ZVI9_9BACT|nr:alpha/beta hydrolase-fold protein [Hymenobacter busanensis]KAA9339383.1 T9SS type A sorting domain-containing protein [Hymenobacter busanensis]QHJ06856.1 T9SS type A sorting domain-containing protein [Hymenobacter busanensis]
MRLFSLLLFLLSPLAGMAQTTMRLTSVPANTPANATLYVAGNFNNWNPAGTAFTKQASGTYEVTLPATVTGVLEFKFTRGAWASVEADAQGADVANRRYTVGGAPATVDFQVASWKDLAGGGSGSCTSTALQPNVQVISTAFQMPQLGRTRRVWVSVPADYATGTRRYPVLYMHDGQNVFDNCTSFSGEWGVDETLNQLQQQGLDPTGCIVVAVDNDGAQRLNEYSPWNNPQYGGGQGDQYVDFLVQTLKPYIDGNYRTLPDRLNTGIAGSSMGGLISLYAALKYPSTFGRTGIFSPAFWFAEAPLKAYLHQHPAPAGQPTRFYFVCGAQESQTMVPLMRAVRDSLQRGGYAAADLNYQVRADGQHAEWFWKREFPAAYQWLYRPATPTKTKAPGGAAVLSVFPNPAAQHVLVQLPAGWHEAKLDIVDTTGRVVVHRSLRQASTTVDVASLKAGTYSARLKSGKDTVATQFVKE